jgi:hypothetical protein
VRFIYFISWEKAQVFNCPPSASLTVVRNRMEQIYLRFKIDTGTKKTNDKPKTWLTKAFEKSVNKVLKTILPNANPDFDDKIDDVDEWLVEINEETAMPEREIGINNNGQTIMVMPFGKNYGYWTDNNLKLDDFVELFKAKRIAGKEFNDRWDKFENERLD